MADEWIKTTIGEQATLQRGIDITKAQQRSGTIPVISSGGVSSYHDTPAAMGPGVILGRKGVVGSVYFISSDYWPHDTTLWVKDFHGNNRRFVYYFFKWMAPRIATMDVGSANPTLNRNHVHPIAIRWPPLPEQCTIAHILGTLDDKIELNRRMNETLEAMARAIFKSWFIDFDPVRRNMARKGRKQPSPVVARHPLSLGESQGEGVIEGNTFDHLFPDRFQDSELGEIPRGWGVVPLPETIDVNPPRPLTKGQVAPYLDMGNMPTRGHRPEQWTPRPFGSGMRFMNGDTLLARITPCLENGKTALVDFLRDGEIGWGSTEYIVLRPKPPLPTVFGYFLARSKELRTFAIQNMTGSSGRQRVPAECFGQYLITVPPTAIAQHFGAVVEPLMTQIRVRCEESYTLAAIRDALLPKLLSGEVRLRESIVA